MSDFIDTQSKHTASMRSLNENLKKLNSSAAKSSRTRNETTTLLFTKLNRMEKMMKLEFGNEKKMKISTSTQHTKDLKITLAEVISNFRNEMNTNHKTVQKELQSLNGKIGDELSDNKNNNMAPNTIASNLRFMGEHFKYIENQLGKLFETENENET